jgi:hypothetical protein
MGDGTWFPMQAPELRMLSELASKLNGLRVPLSRYPRRGSNSTGSEGRTDFADLSDFDSDSDQGQGIGSGTNDRPLSPSRAAAVKYPSLELHLVLRPPPPSAPAVAPVPVPGNGVSSRNEAYSSTNNIVVSGSAGGGASSRHLGSSDDGTGTASHLPTILLTAEHEGKSRTGRDKDRDGERNKEGDRFGSIFPASRQLRRQLDITMRRDIMQQFYEGSNFNVNLNFNLSPHEKRERPGLSRAVPDREAERESEACFHTLLWAVRSQAYMKP